MADSADGDAPTATNKRTHDDYEGNGEHEKHEHDRRDETEAEVDADSSDSDSDMGPKLPMTVPKKKRRTLKHEKLFVSALPAGRRYSKSLMHKETVSHLTLTPGTDFLITTSVDGVHKFWKKVADGIEFVKEFKVHEGRVAAVAASADGRSFASAGAADDDRTVQIFDVATFDLVSLIQLAFVPRCVCWVHQRGASRPLLAVSERDAPAVHIFDGRGEASLTKDEPLRPVHTLKLHRAPVALMAYCAAYDCVVSADTGGMLEYWKASGTGAYAKPDSVWRLKSATDLFVFKRERSVPVALAMAPSGQQFATLSTPDRRVRLFDFASGKLVRTYDESLRTAEDMQQAGTALRQLDAVEFGRRLAAEHAVDSEAPSLAFDESSHFLLYGSMLGVKVVNTVTNKVVRLYGGDESFRPLQLALYQGQPQKKGVTTVAMAASSNPLLQASEARDPILFATGVGKQRFYLFTDAVDVPKGAARDILNERPVRPRTTTANGAPERSDGKTGTNAVIHTSYGDIALRLFPGSAPKAVENFATHARRGYYNNTIFHRVIRKFMIQGGDPLGDGTGGESIWGHPFEDEFGSIKHDKPYTLSMANAGPGTNGSQFFITTEKTPWLDNKHTVFGRAYAGMDVIHRIEAVRTTKERPDEDIKILSIDIS